MNARRDEYLNEELRKEKVVRRREKQVAKQNKAERKERCQRRRDQKAEADQVAAEAAETRAMAMAELDSRTRWVQLEAKLGHPPADAPRRRPPQTHTAAEPSRRKSYYASSYLPEGKSSRHSSTKAAIASSRPTKSSVPINY